MKVQPLQISPDSLVEEFSLKLFCQDMEKKREKRSAVASAEDALCSLFLSEFRPTALKDLKKKWEAYENAPRRFRFDLDD